MAALGTKRILCWGLRMWASTEHATQLPIDQRVLSLHTLRNADKDPESRGSSTGKTFACNCV